MDLEIAFNAVLAFSSSFELSRSGLMSYTTNDVSISLQNPLLFLCSPFNITQIDILNEKIISVMNIPLDPFISPVKFPITLIFGADGNDIFCRYTLVSWKDMANK